LESGVKQAEYDIHMALLEAGYESRLLGVYSNVNDLLDGIRAQKPDLVFNTCEAFQRRSALEMNVAALLEMLGVPYTGSPPSALLLGRDKALAKKILLFHQVQVPRFGVCTRGQPVNGMAELSFPLIVKPLAEDGSKGIAQTSVVKDQAALCERVTFVHQSLAQDALVEELIEGREIYIGVLGNETLQVLPVIEMRFDKLPGSKPRIASYRAKWDPKFRERHGIANVFPTDLEPGVVARLEEVGRTAYRALNLRDYARIDVRMTPDGRAFVLEANPNPYLAYGEDMADAAERAGMSYPQFISRIVELAWERRPRRRGE
jgi:D-alanine-D-alanine ligase